MRVARKIAYNVAVSTISKIGSTILALVAIGLITRYLGQSGFGNYATVLAFFSFFAALSDLGLYSISTREISRPGADEEKIMSNIFALNIVSSLAIIVIAPILVLFFPYTQEVKNAIIVVAVAYLFSSAYQVLNGVFQKNLAMDKVAISEFLGKILQVGVIILAVKYKLSFSWIIASILFCMIFTFVVVMILSRKYIKIRFRFDPTYWKNFLKESYPMGLAAIITFLYFKMDTILLSVMRTSAEVGIYNAAYKVIENISFFPGMIMGLIFPIMSHSIFSDWSRFKDISDKTFKIFVLLVIPLVIGTLFLSGGIIHLIGGGGFVQSTGVLEVLIFALAFIFFGNFMSSALIAGNLQKKLMWILGAAAVFNITLNYFWAIPHFSYWGAAVVSVLTEFLVAAATFVLVARKLRYLPRVERSWGIVLAGIFMAIFLYFFRGHNFFLAGTLSVLIYAAFLWLFKTVRTEEITSIISRTGVEEYEPH